MTVWVLINETYLNETEVDVFSERDLALEYIETEFPEYERRSVNTWIDGLNSLRLLHKVVEIGDNLQAWQKKVLLMTSEKDSSDKI